MYRFLHLYEYFTPASLQKHLVDLQIEHWEFGKRYGLWQCLKCSPWAESLDNAPFDLTIGPMGGLARDSVGEGFAPQEHEAALSKIWLRSFVTSNTTVAVNSPVGVMAPFHVPVTTSATGFAGFVDWLSDLPLNYISRLIGRFRFAEGEKPQPPLPSFDSHTESTALTDHEEFMVEEWWENDGICPVISEAHPSVCHGEPNIPGEEYCVHATGVKLGKPTKELRPGVWYVNELYPCAHLEMRSWHGTNMQREFWYELFTWLWFVDQEVTTVEGPLN